jgi:hypothetical protein
MRCVIVFSFPSPSGWMARAFISAYRLARSGSTSSRARARCRRMEWRRVDEAAVRRGTPTHATRSDDGSATGGSLGSAADHDDAARLAAPRPDDAPLTRRRPRWVAPRPPRDTPPIRDREGPSLRSRAVDRRRSWSEGSDPRRPAWRAASERARTAPATAAGAASSGPTTTCHRDRPRYEPSDRLGHAPAAARVAFFPRPARVTRGSTNARTASVHDFRAVGDRSG